jgi:flagellar motor switch protein FliN
MTTFFDCWIRVATDLFSQALAGEPLLVESGSDSTHEEVFGFAAAISGTERGQFSVFVENTILDAPLLGEGMDQKAGWSELLLETFDAAAGELLAKTGNTIKVEAMAPIAEIPGQWQGFELRAGDRVWKVLVANGLAAAEPAHVEQNVSQDASPVLSDTPPVALNPGLELLLDVELEASLRFGCREMPLGELLEMGPGDVVQLDRHVSDPVDLIVGDKIVARGEVVLVNGNFGLRVTEVAAPRKRLESIRCLF